MSRPSKLDLVSRYMSQRVLGGHVISLELDEDSRGHMKGTARIDPNACSLDLWGDRGVCTRIAIREEDVEATVMRTPDEQRLGRVHWVLRIPGQPEAKVSLIEHPRAGHWYLTVQSDEEGTVIVPLFDARLFEPRTAGRDEDVLPEPAQEPGQEPRARC